VCEDNGGGVVDDGAAEDFTRVNKGRVEQAE
jgi:hypothetical protein